MEHRSRVPPPPPPKIPRKQPRKWLGVFRTLRYAGTNFMGWLGSFGITWPVIGTLFIATAYITFDEKMTDEVTSQQARAREAFKQQRRYERVLESKRKLEERESPQREKTSQEDESE